MPLSLRTPPSELTVAREDVVDDSVDVPAAVVCAVCGDAACSGCERALSRSGIVALVAWERPTGSAIGRMWATARATTISGDEFFDLLPDGPIVPALRFAVLVELVASLGLTFLSLPLITLCAPGWVRRVLLDGGARDVASRALVVGIPALALMLVAAHAAHGLALDHGARRVGARGARGRALRFGLYATGWDLMLGPVGVLVLGFKEGFGAAVSLMRLGVGLPGRCTRAFLRAYGVHGDRAERANGSATLVAVIVTILAAMAVLLAAAVVVVGIG